MLSTYLRKLKGYVRISLKGYSPERFLNLCKSKKIVIWDLENKGIYYEMCMGVKDFKRLRPLCKKSKAQVKILKRYGLPFQLYGFRKRKMFFVGIFFCVSFLYVMSLFIWNIEIEGNYSRTSDVIIDYLETEDIVHGMAKREVDCTRIQELVRIEFPDIIWVSAEIKGTRLFLHIKENENPEIEIQETMKIEERSIVAEKEALITSVLVRKGVAKVEVGEKVEEDTILVSGEIEILNDQKEVVEYQYTQADADIYARTSYTYENEFLLSHEEKKETGKVRKGVYLQIGNQRFTLDLKPKYEKYHTWETEKQVRLTESFYLPIIFGKRTYEEYENYILDYTKEEAKVIAEGYLHEFLEKLSQKGVQILENNVTIVVTENSCKAYGTIEAIEKIGNFVPVEKSTLPELEGKEDLEGE